MLTAYVSTHLAKLGALFERKKYYTRFHILSVKIRSREKRKVPEIERKKNLLLLQLFKIYTPISENIPREKVKNRTVTSLKAPVKNVALNVLSQLAGFLTSLNI